MRSKETHNFTKTQWNKCTNRDNSSVHMAHLDQNIKIRGWQCGARRPINEGPEAPLDYWPQAHLIQANGLTSSWNFKKSRPSCNWFNSSPWWYVNRWGLLRMCVFKAIPFSFKNLWSLKPCQMVNFVEYLSILRGHVFECFFFWVFAVQNLILKIGFTCNQSWRKVS